MRARPVAVAALLSLALVTGSAARDAPAPPHVPGEVILRLRPGVTAAAARDLLAAYGLRGVREVQPLAILLARGDVSRSAPELARALAARPEVEFAHPNYIGDGGVIPNDTHFPSQWHHENTGSTGGTPGADIRSVAAWDLTRGDPAVVVAVLDTGIERAHPEFTGRMLQGYDFVNDDADPEADHSHGILATGLAAANADNAFAVAGVDHAATILPVKVLDQANAGTTMWLIEGLAYAGPLARVISLSLINYPDTAGLQAALQAARDDGAILVACAGNGGLGNADVSMPGKSPLTISVGATTSTDVRASFSGTGTALDVVAPGAGVATTRWRSTADEFASFSGCSAATPVVAGIASLALAIDPALTHDEIRQALRDGADDEVGDPAEDTPGRDDYHGWGRVNAWRTLCLVRDRRVGSLGNRLLAARQGSDVVLAWPLGIVVPDAYNVHRGAAKTEIDKSAYTAPLRSVGPVTTGSFTDSGAVPGPAGSLGLYEVFGRNCTGASVIP